MVMGWNRVWRGREGFHTWLTTWMTDGRLTTIHQNQHQRRALTCQIRQLPAQPVIELLGGERGRQTCHTYFIFVFCTAGV